MKGAEFAVKNALLRGLFLAIFLCLLPGKIQSAICTDNFSDLVLSGTCDVSTEGLAEPPFLSYGVKPNALLFIDNSASMYDLAYVPETAASQGYCFDDSYVLSTAGSDVAYVGYFETRASAADTVDNVWYKYDLGAEKFIKSSTVAADCSGTTKYSNDDVCLVINTAADPDVVTYFAAKGRFLNWAAASKFDVEKWVLTGGKLDDDPDGDKDPETGIDPDGAADDVTDRLVLESRGCMGKTFIKQVTVHDPAAAAMKLTLSIEAAGNYQTRINIYEVSAAGMIVADCQEAIDAFSDPGGAVLGTVKTETKDCLDPMNTGLMASGTAFNHIMQECWYFNDHGEWQPGAGTISSLKNDCAEVYNAKNPPQPPTPDEETYLEEYAPEAQAVSDVCYGKYGTTEGFVGRCWEPTYSVAGGSYVDTPCTPGTDLPLEVFTGLAKETHTATRFCASNHSKWVYCNGSYNASKGTCVGSPGTWQIEQTFVPSPGGEIISVDWTNDINGTFIESGSFTNADDCVDQSLKKWCANIDEAPVVDPTDAISSTGTTYNVPAILMSTALDAQKGEPLLSMKGRVQKGTWAGVLDEFADDINFGIMSFKMGPYSECAPVESPAGSGRYEANLYNCLLDKGVSVSATSLPDPALEDGATLVAPIGSALASVQSGINALTAQTWTPTSEAYFNAIAYYGQNNACCFDSNCDEFVGAGLDPVTEYCQKNNVILLTDGASTADQNSKMVNFVLPAHDVDTADSPYDCGALEGSTLLDDLAYYASTGDFYSAARFTDEDGNPITGDNLSLFVVATGTLRDVAVAGLPAECDSETLLTKTALNGYYKDGVASGSLYRAERPDLLLDAMRNIFVNLITRASAGSAASVISSSRGGEGAIYQAIFWPNLEPGEVPDGNSKNDVDGDGDEDLVSWAGEVHSLFVDSLGDLYEDTNGNRELDIDEDTNGDGTVDTADSNDKRVIIYFDEIDRLSKACYGELVNEDKDGDGTLDAGEDTNGNGTLEGYAYCYGGDIKALDEVKYIWSAGDWLAKISESADFSPYDATDVRYNRSDLSNSNGKYISADRRRLIFTWNDLDNDGIIDANEKLPLEAKDTSAGDTWDWGSLATGGGRGSVVKDFAAASKTEVNNIINWLRGEDIAGKRPRLTRKDINHDGEYENITWRLGDVIHSTPMVVSRPSEGYHFLYRDFSYSQFFANHYSNRRHMLYFGGNDGMLHAVNGGFYNEKEKKFCLSAARNADGTCNETATPLPELGAELWAYVPYNLLPHLESLTDPEYKHKYYVDLRPRIFDVRIFPTTDEDHKGGWGTILVGGMRFGGARIGAQELNGVGTDDRVFTSAYFILDITNPEKPPTLLGEFTWTRTADSLDEADLGYTLPIPTVAFMKKDSAPTDTYNDKVVTRYDDHLEPDEIKHDYAWYLVLGSGPTNLKGESTQNANVAVIPLKWLADGRSLRIPDNTPSASSVTHPEGGIFELKGSPTGFVSDLVTVDYELNSDYMSDAVYFGTVEGNFASGWDGQLYRLVSRQLQKTGDVEAQVFTAPSDWATLTPKDGLNYKPLYNAGQPVVAAPAIGADKYNFWVYFGTGRFFDPDDKADAQQQTFYGIKEPMDCNGAFADWYNFTWATVQKTIDEDSTTPGQRGLLRTDQIEVTARTGLLSCVEGVEGCLPDGVDNFTALKTYIAGSGCVDPDDDETFTATGIDGWYKNFDQERERNLGQATLLGGLLLYTSYQPFDDACKAEGEAELYGLYYQTGTPYYLPVFGDDRGLRAGKVVDRLYLGRGLATTPNLQVGEEGGPKAFVQTSTGAIEQIDTINTPEDFTSGRASWIELTE